MEALETLGVYWPKLIAQVINFIIILTVLRLFAYKPVMDLLEKRRQRIQESLEKAEQIDRQLEEANQRAKEIISEASRKADEIVAEARQSAESIGAKKVAEAVAQAEDVISKAHEAARRERDQMMGQLRSSMGRLVVDTTAKVVGRALTDEDQQRLQKEAVVHLS